MRAALREKALATGRGPCRLCPRNCGIVRQQAQGTGFCGMGTQAVVARAAAHHWEEPCISGTRGSGTVFFAGCTLRCAFCQNHAISHLGQGRRLDEAQLAQCFLDLQSQQVHNLSLVTASHFLPAILSALAMASIHIPIVYNCGGYERLSTLQALDGIVDVYLPDLKHVSPRLSGLCAGAADYFAHAGPAVTEMCRQTGLAVFDAQGLMVRGTLVRHLVLPGCTQDSLRVLDFVHQHLPKGTYVSLMRQYTPSPHCAIPGLERPLRNDEYERVAGYMRTLDIPGFVQDPLSADSAYTPTFDLTGVPDNIPPSA